jgi:NitT/TauT family transport system substrate-binding protein
MRDCAPGRKPVDGSLASAGGTAHPQRMPPEHHDRLGQRCRGAVMKAVSILLFASALLMVGNGTGTAADTLKVAVPQRGAWDTSISEIGHRAGIFKKHDIVIDLLFTGGGAEALGAIIGGSIDVAVSVGFSTVLGSYSKGAPLRVFSAETTGQPDIYWFVPSQSPIRSVADFRGKTIGYSVSGSSSHAAILALLAQEKTTARPTSTGGVTPSFTSGMTGQVDVGWTTIPMGLKEIEEGTIRAVARASDVVSLRDRTVRVNITSANVLGTRKAALERYMAAYRETIDYMYAAPEALTMFAEIANVPLAVAQKIPALVPKSALSPDQIIGMEAIMAEAVATKFMSAPLTREQIAELVRMPAAPR